MKLYLAKAIGRGSTELAAFDAALVGAGVANFNLIRLSSVIPPNGEIVEVERCPFAAGRGVGRSAVRRLRRAADQRPRRAGLGGVGWSQDRETGRGLFVEHEGAREQDVREQIAASLQRSPGDPRARPRPDPHLCRRCDVHRRPDLRARHLRLRHRALADDHRPTIANRSWCSRDPRGRDVDIRRSSTSAARTFADRGLANGADGAQADPTGGPLGGHRRRHASCRRVRSTSSRPRPGALLGRVASARWSVPGRRVSASSPPPTCSGSPGCGSTSSPTGACSSRRGRARTCCRR